MSRPIAFMLLFSAAANGGLRAQSLETVRVGSPVLRGATLRVGSDTVDDYIVNEQGRQLTATTVRTITIRPDSVEPSYEIKTLHWAAHGDTSVSVMMVRAQDLSLLFHRVKAARDSAAVNASRAHLTAWVVLPNQPIRLLDLPLSSPVFGVEGQIPWLFPLLPLGLNYRAAVPHFSQWDGRERWDTVTVLSAERVTIGPYAFDCWKVDVGALGPPGYRMTRWVDRRTRRVVQSVLRGSSGPEYWSYLRSS